MTELPKTFDPAAIEARWYAHWESTNAFRPDRPEAEPFTIVIPPPNVTGSLHIGHALDLTLQDILIRHARLKGKDALWVVGTDHAGIATQMVVERQMAERGEKRTDFTRDEFIAKVWEWKEESGGAITGQMRRLGASCDWANERFTMDQGFSRAVRKVFVDLYDRKLLYRDKRLVNWDPGLKTAISDLEVETHEVNGKFWHLSYPLADGSGAISVATTRPETMLADMAVAVNATDTRYTHLVGKQVRLPITGRLVPIITDEHANPELGSGVVKITPGHDFNDFEVGKRAGFKAADMLNMFDGDAKVIQCGGIPDELLGLDRFAARARVVEMIEAAGLLEKVEDRVVQTPYGDRSGVVIEPWLTDQWYVDATTLAGPAIAAVRDGDIRVVPETWKKTWFNWLENIQPWCVSRQLWWGHQIPAWYGPGISEDEKSIEMVRPSSAERLSRTLPPELFVADTEAQAIKMAEHRYAQAGFKSPVGLFVEATTSEQAAWDAYDKNGDIGIWRDGDVLDTWFSSALWPFATLGWPEDEAEKPFVPSENEGRSGPRASTKFIQSNAAGGVEGLGTNEPGSDSRPSLLRRHYPNDVLISGFDIIFFWDARMAMQGFEFMKERPWKTLYLHGLVRDAKGAKMSKSKGNTVDPLGLIDRFGADALRFTLAAMESQGRDIKLDEKRIEGYRNFATKLWNAARFAQANGIGASQTIEPPLANLPVNRWIIGETVRTVQALDLALADLRFDESARLIYQLTWDRYCDWYLELIKPVLQPLQNRPDDSLVSTSDWPDMEETRAVAAWVLDQILVMLHPFMPFITEELWHAMGARGGDLIHAKWPIPDARALDPEAGLEIDWLIRLVSGIRAARTELGVTPGVRLALHVVGAEASTIARLTRNEAAVRRMARIESIDHTPAPAGGAAQIVLEEATFILPLEGVIDIAAERARLGKALAQAEKERDALAKRLDSPGFVEKAKPDAIDKARADHAERSEEAERIGAALARLS